MIDKIYKTVVLSILLCSCGSTYRNKMGSDKNLFETKELDSLSASHISSLLADNNIDSLYAATTSDFYLIDVKVDLKKTQYTLNEKKEFDIKVVNYGTEDLYMPEWLRRDHTIRQELSIEIYRKGRKGFKPYIQKTIKTNTLVQPKISKRELSTSSRGKPVFYENIEMDTYLKIVDEGTYKIKVYIDLSSFGYFKKLTAVSSQFEIIR